MRKTILAASLTLALFAGAAYAPYTASADEMELLAANEPYLGTVETMAVTAPISVGGITYIPGAEATGGAAPLYYGTVETAAVTAPISVGGITYIPGG